MQRRSWFAAVPFWALGLIAVALGLCGLGGLLGFVILTSDESNASSGEAAAPRTEPGACVIRMRGSSDRVPLFETESDYDAFGEASATRDTHGQQEAFSRSGFWVESGTRCLVLSGGLTRARVRVLGGPNEGKAGWLPAEWTGG